MKICHVFGALALMVTANATEAANPVVLIDTSVGPIKIELYEDKAPVTVKNFLSYVDKKHYDNLIFHRVIEDFMIQGGGFDKEQKEQRTDPAIKNEAANGLKNERGTIAMARTSNPNSATSQFFINVKSNDSLNFSPSSAGYCVFGRVIDGMDVVDKIRKTKTGPKGMFPSDVPQEDVVIKSVRRAEAK